MVELMISANWPIRSIDNELAIGAHFFLGYCLRLVDFAGISKCSVFRIRQIKLFLSERTQIASRVGEVGFGVGAGAVEALEGFIQ